MWLFSREGWDDMRPFVLVGFVYLLTLTAAVCFGADAALAASLFHYGELTIREVKEHLKSRGIPVRL